MFMQSGAAVPKFRRRKEGVTNYKKRLALVKSGLDRVVVRKSNRRIIGQLVRYEEKGDAVLARADSGELKPLCGWPGRANRPTAYLTGLLLARKAKGAGERIVLDIGLSSPVRDSIPFAFAKGCVDGGLKLVGTFDIAESTYDATGIVKYAEALRKSQPEAAHFSEYAKEGKVEALPELFRKAKEKLMKG